MKKQLTLLISFTFLLVTQVMSARSITVSGVIYDQSGKTNPDANFVKRMPANSADVDLSIKYTIKDSGLKAVFVFSANSLGQGLLPKVSSEAWAEYFLFKKTAFNNM